MDYRDRSNVTTPAPDLAEQAEALRGMLDAAAVVNWQRDANGTSPEIATRRQTGPDAWHGEALLLTIVDSLPGLLSYWNRECRCEFANAAYMEWFGKTADELIGSHIRDLLGEQLYAMSEPAVLAVLAGEPQEFERTLAKPSGESRHTRAHYIPHRMGGEVCGFFILVFDITALKTTQLQLAAANDELQLRKTQAEQASQAKSHFLASASHALRTPLNGVLGMAQLLLQPQLESAQRIDYAQTILNSGRTQQRLIENLLDRSKVEAEWPAPPAPATPPPAPPAPAQAHGDSPAAGPSPGPSPGPLPGRFAGRVLVVEDHPVNRKVIVAMLERLGLHVTLAEDGQQALAAISRADRPDLVFMDIQMPILDGCAAAQEIRRRERQLSQPRLPLIACTAAALEGDQRRCQLAGFDDFLAKPINHERLLALLERWLPSAAGQAPRADAKQLASLVAEIIPLLNHHKFDAIARYKELQQAVAGTAAASEIAAAGAMLAEFRFDAVLDRLPAIAAVHGWEYRS